MNVYVAGAIWVIGVAAAAAGITILVHRFAKRGNAGDDDSSADAITGVFTIVAGLQAVLLAFVLISLFDAVSTVREDSDSEANALVGVYWASDALPAPAKADLHELTRSYASTVADREWPSMRKGAPAGGSGLELLHRMRETIDGVPADSDWQQERKSEAASQLWGVYEARQARLSAASNAGVSTVVWLALIVGSVLSIALPYLFDVSKLMTHMLIIATLAGTITLLMFAIYQLQNPFSGGARVEPDAFRAAASQMLGRAA